jgi:hypothetical protein
MTHWRAESTCDLGRRAEDPGHVHDVRLTVEVQNEHQAEPHPQVQDVLL